MVGGHDQKTAGDLNERADRTIVNMVWPGGIVSRTIGAVESEEENEMVNETKGKGTGIEEGIGTAMVTATARKTRTERGTGSGTGTDIDEMTRIVTGTAKNQGVKLATPVHLSPILTAICLHDLTRGIAMVIPVLRNRLGNGGARLMMTYAIFLELVDLLENSYSYPSPNVVLSAVHAKNHTVMSAIDGLLRRTSVNATRNTSGKSGILMKATIVLPSQIRLVR